MFLCLFHMWLIICAAVDNMCILCVFRRVWISMKARENAQVCMCVCACEREWTCLLSSIYIWGVCLFACPCVCLHAPLFLTPCPAVGRPRQRLHQPSPGCKWTPRSPAGRPPPGRPTWSVPPADALILGREIGEDDQVFMNHIEAGKCVCEPLYSLHFQYGIHEVLFYNLSSLWIFWCNRQTFLSMSRYFTKQR